MKKENITVNAQLAYYFSINSLGDDAHFYPGNGLPNGVYKPLLNLLSNKYNLTSLAYRASWENSGPQNNQVNWNSYADDLIAYLEQKYKNPIVGIGHSQGATATIIAAAKRPDLFKELFLLEPVSVTTFDELYIGLLPYFIKKKREPFKSALQKKFKWANIAEYYEFIQSSKGFKRIKPENLQVFAEESLKVANNGGFELVFPVDWEVANYALPLNINEHLKKLEIPHKIILGKPSFFTTEKVRTKWNDFVKGEIVINNNYGHLIPLEAPEFCAEKIIK